MGVKSESKWRRAVVLRIRDARVKAAAGKIRKDQASGKVVRSKATHFQRQLSIQFEQCTCALDLTMHSNSVYANKKHAKTKKNDVAVSGTERRLATNPRL